MGIREAGLAALWTASALFAGICAARSDDCNHNGVPDECELRPFRRGDSNADGAMDISDAMAILGHLFLGGAPLGCLESADANDDARLNTADPVYLLNYLFLGGAPPPAPGPAPGPCGGDPMESSGHLGCTAYEAC